MITEKYHVHFDFVVDHARLTIPLEADVEEHHSRTYFVVTNIRALGHAERSILPDIWMQKDKGIWVHTDSGKETQLSTAVGQAVDMVKAPI